MTAQKKKLKKYSLSIYKINQLINQVGQYIRPQSHRKISHKKYIYHGFYKSDNSFLINNTMLRAFSMQRDGRFIIGFYAEHQLKELIKTRHKKLIRAIQMMSGLAFTSSFVYSPSPYIIIASNKDTKIDMIMHSYVQRTLNIIPINIQVKSAQALICKNKKYLRIHTTTLSTIMHICGKITNYNLKIMQNFLYTGCVDTQDYDSVLKGCSTIKKSFDTIVYHMLMGNKHAIPHVHVIMTYFNMQKVDTLCGKDPLHRYPRLDQAIIINSNALLDHLKGDRMVQIDGSRIRIGNIYIESAKDHYKPYSVCAYFNIHNVPNELICRVNGFFPSRD